MSASTDSYQVIYKALADFASFKKASTEAQAELDKLKKSQKSYNDSVVTGEAKATAARSAATKEIQAEKKALEDDTKALRQHAAAALADAAATKEDAKARAELAAADKKRSGGGGSAGNVKSDEAAVAKEATVAKKETTKADRALMAEEKKLQIQFLTTEQAEKMAAAAARKRTAEIKAASAALHDSIAAEKQSSQEQSAHSTVVRDAIKTVERLRAGQIEASAETRNAMAVVAEHRASVAAAMAAEKQRVAQLGTGTKAQDDNAASGKRLTGVLGLIQNALISVGKSSADSGGGKPPFLKDLSKGIDEVEGKIGSMVGFLASGLKFGALIGLIAPLISALQAGGAAALGMGADVASLGGLALAAAPGLAALLTGALALVIGIKSVMGAFSSYKNVVAAQTSANTAGANGLTEYQSAVIGLADAENTLGNAVQSTKDAQNSLNEARVQALRSLQDLQKAVRRGPLDEKAAAAALQIAKEDYLRTMASPGATIGQRQQAGVAVQQAQNALTDTQTQNTRNQQDLTVANKKGVEGSDAVVHALEAQANAQFALVKAYQGLAQAQHVAAAGGSGLATATAAYNAALKKLDPVARQFVTGLVAQKDAWSGIVKLVQRNLFGPVVGDLGRIKDLAGPVSDLLGKSASALGGIADKGIKMVTSGPWTRDFGVIADQNAKLIGTMGDSGLSLLDVLKNLVIIAGPFTQKLAEAFAKGADNLDRLVSNARDSGKLATWLDHVYKRAALFWDIIKNIAFSIGNLAGAATSFNDGLLVSLDNITKRWRATTKAQEDNGSKFKKYLDDIKPLLHSMAQFFGDLAREFGKIGANPDNIKSAIDIFQKLDALLPGIGDALTNISNLHVPAALIDVFHKILDIVQQLNKIGIFGLLKDFADGLGLVVGALTALAWAYVKVSDFFAWLDKLTHGTSGYVTGFTQLSAGIKLLVEALGLLAGAAIIAKYTGLFRLVKLISEAKAGTSFLNKIPGLNKVIGGARAAASPLDAPAAALKGSATALDTAADALIRAAELLAKGGGPLGAEKAAAKEAQSVENAAVNDVSSAKRGGAHGGLPMSEEEAAARTGGKLGAAPLGNEVLATGGGKHRATSTKTAKAAAKSQAKARARAAGLSDLTDSLIADTSGRLGIGGAAVRDIEGVAKVGKLSKVTGFLGKLLGGGAASGVEGAAGGKLKGVLGGLAGKAGIGAGIYMGGQLASGLISGGQTRGARAAAGGIVGDAATGASIGMLAGPWGAAAGAAVGGIYGVLTKTPAGKIIGQWFTKTVIPELKKLPKQLLGVGKDILKFLLWPYQEAWKGISAGWKAFTTAISVAFKDVMSVAKKIWDVWLDIIEAPFKLAWAWYKLQWSVLRAIFDEGIALVKDGLKLGWAGLKLVLIDPVEFAWHQMENIWGKITGVFDNAKDVVIKSVGLLASGVKKIWDDVKGIFEAPIKFVINTVLNDGLISGINWVTSHIGLGGLKIGPIKLPFADGDWVPGRGGSRVPGSGTGDTVDAKLTPGEFVIRKAAAQVLGSDFLRSLNYADKMDNNSRQKLAPGTRQGYFWGDSVLGDVLKAGETAWNDTGGAAIKWGTKELRQGAAAAMNALFVAPAKAAINGTLGSGRFGLPGKAVGSEGVDLLNSALGWVKGIDHAHKAATAPAQKKADGGFINDLLSGAGLNGGTGTLPGIGMLAPPRLQTSTTNHSSSTTTNRGLNIEKLDIHYPKPETGGESITRAVQRANFLAGRGL